MQIEIQMLWRRHDTGDDADVLLFGSRGDLNLYLLDEALTALGRTDKPTEPRDIDDAVEAFLNEQTVGTGSWWELDYQTITL